MSLKKSEKKTSKKKTEQVMDESDLENNEFSNPELLQDVTDTNLDLVTVEVQENKEEAELLPADLKGQDIRKTVVDLRNQVDCAHFELARIVYFIKINELYKDWGYETFTDYARSGEAGQERRVHYFVELHHWLTNDIKDKKRIEGIKKLGWSKAKELIRLPQKDMQTLDKWVDVASDLSLKKLTEAVANEIKTSKNDGEVESCEGEEQVKKEEVKNVTIKLYPEQYEIYTRALETVKKESCSDVQSHNLILILQDYLMNVDIGRDFKQTRVKFLAKAEERLNCKIVGIDKDNEEIFFGKELLEE